VWTYILRRLLLMIPTLFGITIVSFCIMQLAPGDPQISALSEKGTAGESSQTREAYLLQRREMFLDKPLLFNLNYFSDYSQPVQSAAYYHGATDSQISAELLQMAKFSADAKNFKGTKDEKEALEQRFVFLKKRRKLRIVKRLRELKELTPDEVAAAKKKFAKDNPLLNKEEVDKEWKDEWSKRESQRKGRLQKTCEAVKAFVSAWCEDLGHHGVTPAITIIESKDAPLQTKLGAIKALRKMIGDPFIYTCSSLQPSEDDLQEVVMAWKLLDITQSFPKVSTEHAAELQKQLEVVTKLQSRRELFQHLENDFTRDDVAFFYHQVVGDGASAREKAVAAEFLRLYISDGIPLDPPALPKPKAKPEAKDKGKANEKAKDKKQEKEKVESKDESKSQTKVKEAEEKGANPKSGTKAKATKKQGTKAAETKSGDKDKKVTKNATDDHKKGKQAKKVSKETVAKTKEAKEAEAKKEAAAFAKAQKKFDEELAIVIRNWGAYYHAHKADYEVSTAQKVMYIITDTQYSHMVWRLVTFRFGKSVLKTREPVIEKIWKSVQVSAPLMILAQVIIYLIAIPLGIICAINRAKFLDRAISVGLLFLYSIPPFVAGMLFLLLFCYGQFFSWFPAEGLIDDYARNAGPFVQLGNYLWHAFLPVVCLSLFSLAGLTMYARSSMLDVLERDYIRTAWAKGVPRFQIIGKHALRNAMIPIVTLFAGFLPAMLGGSVLIEFLFNIHGMGQLALSTIRNKDIPTVMALLYINAIVVMVSLLITDLLYVLVDPRISFDSQERSA